MSHKALFAFMLLLFSSQAFAESHSQEDIYVTRAGAGTNGGDILVSISPNPTNCLYGGLYFKDSTNEKNFALKVGLAALLSGNSVTIEYTQSADGEKCFGDGVYINKSVVN